MMKQKICLMNGLNTLMNQNNYFIREEIPRFLSKKIDEDYELWFIGSDIEKEILMKKLPKCLSNNIVYYNRNYNLDILDQNDKEESLIFISSNKDKETFQEAGFKNVFKMKKYLNKDIYPKHPIGTIDYIFCFGFDEVDFINFCKTNKSRGFSNNSIVYDLEEPLSLSYNVDKNQSYKENYIIFKNFVDLQNSSNKYKIKHNTHTMAITYQGNEEAMANESKLSILFV